MYGMSIMQLCEPAYLSVCSARALKNHCEALEATVNLILK